MTKASRNNTHYLPYVVLVRNVRVLQRVTTYGEKKHSCSYKNVINRNTLVSLGLVRTLKGWCFNGKENQMYCCGSTSIVYEQKSDHVFNNNNESFSADPLQFIVDKLNQQEIKVDQILRHEVDKDTSEDASMNSVEEE